MTRPELISNHCVLSHVHIEVEGECELRKFLATLCLKTKYADLLGSSIMQKRGLFSALRSTPRKLLYWCVVTIFKSLPKRKKEIVYYVRQRVLIYSKMSQKTATILICTLVIWFNQKHKSEFGTTIFFAKNYNQKLQHFFKTNYPLNELLL